MMASPRRRRTRWIWASVGVAVVVITVGICLYLPIPHSYAFDIPSSASCGGSFENTSYPIGAHVTGSWQVLAGATPAEITILDNGGAPEVSRPFTNVVYQATGTNGSFSFTGAGQYEFEVLPGSPQHVGCVVAPPVSVQGSWSSTLAGTWSHDGTSG